MTLAVTAASLVAAGCGGGSSKPAYCSDVTDLNTSVNDLKGVQINSSSLATLGTTLQKLKTQVDAVVSSAKQDFPNETAALKSAVSTLSTSIDQLPSPPSTKQALALLPQVSTAVTAVDDLVTATKSACD